MRRDDLLGTDLDSVSKAILEESYRKTIEIYSDPLYANNYFEVWKNDIPKGQIDNFLSLLPQKSKILDSGCGPGHHSNYIGQNNYDVIGIDLSDAALSIAKKNYQNAFFYKMDMLKMSFSNNEFDGVWSCASAVHLTPNLLKLQLEEFNRVLNVDGLLSLTISAGKKAHLSPDGRFFYSFKGKDSAIDTVKSNGFEVISCDEQVLEKTTVDDDRIKGKWITLLARKILL